MTKTQRIKQLEDRVRSLEHEVMMLQLEQRTKIVPQPYPVPYYPNNPIPWPQPQITWSNNTLNLPLKEVNAQ